MYDSVWLQGPSHRSSFLRLIFFLFFWLFCSALVLNRDPTCVRKPKTNTFDEPINLVFRFEFSSNLFYSKGIQSNPPWYTRSKSMDWFLYDIGLRHERVKFHNIRPPAKVQLCLGKRSQISLQRSPPMLLEKAEKFER